MDHIQRHGLSIGFSSMRETDLTGNKFRQNGARMTTGQRAKLRQKIKEWRAVAEPVGPQHVLWETIFDAEALLVGRATFRPKDEILAMAEHSH